MPKIYIPKKESKPSKRAYIPSKVNNINHKTIYNTNTWRILRLEKLKKDPLCERCLAKGKINSGLEVHHKIPISTGSTIQQKQILGFNIDNLETLCKECHKEEHSTNTFE